MLALRRLSSSSSSKQSEGKAGGGSSRRSARADGGGGGSVQLGMRLVPRSEFGRLDGPIIDPWETAGYRKRTYSRAHGSKTGQATVQPAAAAAHGSSPALPAATAAAPASLSASDQYISRLEAAFLETSEQATAAAAATRKQHPAVAPAAELATTAKPAAGNQVRFIYAFSFNL